MNADDLLLGFRPACINNGWHSAQARLPDQKLFSLSAFICVHLRFLDALSAQTQHGPSGT